MTRMHQIVKFNEMFVFLLWYARVNGILVRGGEWHRPGILSKIYYFGIDVIDNGVKFFHPGGTGIKGSKHRYSLAVDVWLTSDGRDVLWAGRRPGDKPELDFKYRKLGLYWERLGGRWGGRFKRYDPYHFEFAEPVAR